MRVPAAIERARGAGGPPSGTPCIAAAGVRRFATDATSCDAAGAAARSGADGQRDCPRHQQRTLTDGALDRNAAGEGIGTEPADPQALGDDATSHGRCGEDCRAHEGILPAARAAVGAIAGTHERFGAAGCGPDARSLERYSTTAGRGD